MRTLLRPLSPTQDCYLRKQLFGVKTSLSHGEISIVGIPDICTLPGMGRGQSLTFEEEAKIDALLGENLSEREIAANIKRSKTSVHNYITQSESRRSADRRGRKATISKYTIHAMVREARKGESSAWEIRNIYHAPVTVRRVQQYLSSAQYLKHAKLLQAPRLPMEQKGARFDWARERVGKE